MPSLKDLSCSIELSDSQQSLQEFGTIYGDGFVETFISVPSKPQAFSVHLTSNKFIAPGIALYVFIDGVYQCNRNRQDLKLRKSSDSRSLVDFRVRQKEEEQKDGLMIAREWTFEMLNSVSADGAPDLCSPNILENIGCIEVVVLRCVGTRNAKTASNMNLDGASDLPTHRFGLDGQPRDTGSRSFYDDRGPSANGFGIGNGPPPPLTSYHRPYAETVRSHEEASIARHSRPHSRYSEPINPDARRSSNLPPLGFQYGSGPLPPKGEPFHQRPSSAIVTNAPGVDPVWLDKLLRHAVKQGVEESRRGERPLARNIEHKQRTSDLETASQAPGAWPLSPHSTTLQVPQQPDPAEQLVHSFDEDRGTTLDQSQRGWIQHPTRERAGTHVTWDPEPVWESESNSGNWNSPDEAPFDSWSTDDTWGSKGPQDKEPSSRRGRCRAPTTPSYFDTRPASRVTARTDNRYRSTDSQSWNSGSKSRSRRSRCEDKNRSSSEDRDGWTHIEATSDSVASWENSDDTLQPSHSRSQVHASRSRSEKPSRPSKSTHSNRERRTSQHTHRVPTWQQVITHTGPAPSVITRITPTVMNGQASIVPAEARSRKASMFTEPAASVAPAPTWGCALPERMQKNSTATSYSVPAPYGTPVGEFASNTVGGDRGETRSTPPSSWGSGKKSDSFESSWEDRAEKKRSTGGQNAKGWEVAENDQKDVWNIADDTKNPGGSGWEKKDTSWVVDNSPQQQKDTSGTVDAWDINKGGWKIARDNGDTTKADDVPWEGQAGAWNTQNTNDKNSAVQWKTDTLWAPSPVLEKPAEAASTSKRHTNKSLSKYRQLRSTSPDLTPKPHWQFPPESPKRKLLPIHEDHGSSKVAYVAPKEPLYQISKETASEKGVEHQVRAGKGMQYGHVVGRPEYLDRLDKPYAVFRFKYRSRAILKSMFGDEVPDHGHLTQSTPSSTLAKAKEKLEDLPQAQWIEKMLKLQTKLAQKKATRKEHKHKDHKKARLQATECVARDLTESWVKQQSRNASEKGSVDKEKKEAKKTWEQTAGGNGDWAGTTW